MGILIPSLTIRPQTTPYKEKLVQSQSFCGQDVHTTSWHDYVDGESSDEEEAMDSIPRVKLRGEDKIRIRSN